MSNILFNPSISTTAKILLISFCITACSSVQEKTTLRDIDKVGPPNIQQSSAVVQTRSGNEIRKAYADYLKNASKDDHSRLSAINRLAQLEFELTNKLIENQQDQNQEFNDELDEQLYTARLDKTIELLSTSLRDYPKAKGNDKILYQLAKAYDQRGDGQNATQTLLKLATKYPKSVYSVETQFRLGEAAFARGDYISAEDAYTEVIVSPKNSTFYEKAIFKRGWARFKQQLYLEAVEDYLQAIIYHEFDDIDKLSKTEHEQFDEYFRAVGLGFSYLGGAEPLRNFFQEQDDHKYLYHTYSVVSDIYLKQERYSDSVDTLKQFVQYYPKAVEVPYSHLKIVSLWQQSAFTNKLYEAIDYLYSHYNPDSQYWKTSNTNNEANQTSNIAFEKSLKTYVLLMAEYFHNQYQKKHHKKSYQNAKKWYKRYLKHYSAYAQKDKIYYLYGELLSEGKDYKNAIGYYELAAYDAELILNKEAAYATIVLSNNLYSSSNTDNRDLWLNKHIKYSLLYSQLYTNEQRSEEIIVHASELAYASKQYKRTIELASLITDKANAQTIYNASIIRAQSHFKLIEYSESEVIYAAMLRSDKLSRKNRRQVRDGLALSIYKQAETAKTQNNIEQASADFMRIADVAKSSSIAATGLYDAIALYMNHKLWNKAVIAIKKFQAFYPDHKLSRDVTKKLSVAYLNSNQNLKAAEQFEKISGFEGDKDIKMAALWQAAELYESQKNLPAAIRSYTEYANTYKKPYSQYMESMFKLTELYNSSNNAGQLSLWRKRILNADKNAYKQNKNDRTKYIASSAILGLAKDSHLKFDRYKLVEPLKVNLRKKKKAMQETVKLYGQASVYSISETATEATHAIAKIYQDFSRALLESERPNSLKGEELEQYEILLEDQAFPFEEKAIEFYEVNLSHIKDGIYNDSINNSLNELKKLFPVRYNRKSKIDAYIRKIH